MKNYLFIYVLFVILGAVSYWGYYYEELGVPIVERDRLESLIRKSHYEDEIPFNERYKEVMDWSISNEIKSAEIAERYSRIRNNYNNDPMMFREMYRNNILNKNTGAFPIGIILLYFGIYTSIFIGKDKDLPVNWPPTSGLDWIVTFIIFLSIGLGVICLVRDSFFYIKYGNGLADMLFTYLFSPVIVVLCISFYVSTKYMKKNR